MQIRAFCTTGDIHNNNLQRGGGGGAQFNDSIKFLLLLLLKLYLHTVFSSGFNMQQTKLDKLQK